MDTQKCIRNIVLLYGNVRRQDRLLDEDKVLVLLSTENMVYCRCVLEMKAMVFL